MNEYRLNGDDFFDRWHEDGDAAFQILQDECEVPPSLEVFEHGLEVARERSHLPIDVRQYARFTADTYQRVPGV